MDICGADHYLTAFFNTFAGLNFGIILAATLITFPVLGFLLFLAFLESYYDLVLI